MEYNLFKKTIKGKDGRAAAVWYYWFYDITGKQIQKVCKGCKTKAEAVRFINFLPPLPKDSTKIKDIAEYMYVPGSDHLERRQSLGKKISDETIQNSRRFILTIIEKWGEENIENFDAREVVFYLMKKKYSGGYANNFISVFTEIYDEAFWRGIKCQKPAIPHFRKKAGHKDIFTREEIKKFFQIENFERFAIDAETIYLFFLCSYLAGLRIGEARALRPKQFLFEQNALVVDGFCKYDGTRTTFNKGGSDEKRKTRIVLLPQNFLEQIRIYINSKKIPPEDFIFKHNNAPIRKDYAENIFEKILKRIGIDTKNRQLTPHSLRFTYVTRLRGDVSGDVVQKLVGHANIEMTDYYTKPNIADDLAGISAARNAVEHLLD